MRQPPICPVTVTPYSRLGSGVQMGAFAATAPADALFGTGGNALFYPIIIPQPVVALKMFIYNGSSPASNVDLGIYDEGFRRLVSTGSFAQSGASTIQERDITDTTLSPGRYYLAYATDGNNSVFRADIGLERCRALGMAQTIGSSFPLPASVTPLVVSADYDVLMFGFTTRTLV